MFDTWSSLALFRLVWSYRLVECGLVRSSSIWSWSVLRGPSREATPVQSDPLWFSPAPVWLRLVMSEPRHNRRVRRSGRCDLDGRVSFQILGGRGDSTRLGVIDVL